MAILGVARLVSKVPDLLLNLGDDPTDVRGLNFVSSNYSEHELEFSSSCNVRRLLTKG